MPHIIEAHARPKRRGSYACEMHILCDEPMTYDVLVEQDDGTIEDLCVCGSGLRELNETNQDVQECGGGSVHDDVDPGAEGGGESSRPRLSGVEHNAI